MSAAPVRRRAKWAPPPGPSPRILNLPRRSRLSSSRSTKPPPPQPPSSRRSPARQQQQQLQQQNLGALLEQERGIGFGSFFGDPAKKREKSEPEASASGGDSGEERWRVEAEILRAECKFLRMEREVALRELGKNRELMESSLRSALGALFLGRNKIDGGEEPAAVEVGDLLKLLEELNVGSTRRMRLGKCAKDGKNSRLNFDRQASVLRRRLEELEDEAAASARDIRVIAATATTQVETTTHEPPPNPSCHRSFQDVEKLRMKMEGLSRGMQERMEEYGVFLSGIDSLTVVAAAATKRSGDGKERSGRPHRQCHQHRRQERQVEQEGRRERENSTPGSCCNCKEVLGRVVEQVRSETEQWNEIQRMLDQLKLEMEELQSSRDLWQRRAVNSDHSLRSLRTHVMEWRQRALLSERKATELKERNFRLHTELHSLRAERFESPPSSPPHSEIWIPEPARIKGEHQQQRKRAVGLQKEKEKHVLLCRLKKDTSGSHRQRLPLQDIRNSTLLFRD